MTHKVLFIHHGGGVGGAPVSMLQLAAALDRRRYEPLVVFSAPGPILNYARELGVPAQVAPLRSAFFYGAQVPINLRMLASFLVNYRSTIKSAQDLVRREQPDLVHINSIVPVPAAAGVKRQSVPIIWHLREVLGPNTWLRRMHAEAIMRLADGIVANSHTSAEAFPADASITVVPNAVDLDRFDIDELKARSAMRSELGLPQDSLVVGMIGSVQSTKGHDLLVRSARRVVREVPETRFMIVAGGVGFEYTRSWKGLVKRAMNRPMDNLDRLRRQVEAAGLQDHFVYTGYRTDVPEAIAAMDVLAFLPQATEGFGRPLIEAMAIGRAVVASDIGPSREILGDGTGTLVPPGDAAALSDALIDLLSDPESRGIMGQRGRQRAKACFGLDQSVLRMQDFYDQVLGLAAPSQAVAQSTVN